MAEWSFDGAAAGFTPVGGALWFVDAKVVPTTVGEALALGVTDAGPQDDAVFLGVVPHDFDPAVRLLERQFIYPTFTPIPGNNNSGAIRQ